MAGRRMTALAAECEVPCISQLVQQFVNAF